MHYKVAVAFVLAGACAGAGAKPGSMRSKESITQKAVTPSGAAPGSTSPDEPIDISQFKHPRDDDESQDAVSSQGADARRDPYWREFAEQLFQAWAPPTGTMAQDAAGCFHILPDGKIAEIRLMTPSGDEGIDESIRLAMTSMQNTRDKHPMLVPTDQLALIKSWVCFKFTADAQARHVRTPSAPSSK